MNCFNITPILAFPHRGGRDFESVIIAALGIYIPLSAYQGGREL